MLFIGLHPQYLYSTPKQSRRRTGRRKIPPVPMGVLAHGCSWVFLHWWVAGVWEKLYISAGYVGLGDIHPIVRGRRDYRFRKVTECWAQFWSRITKCWNIFIIVQLGPSSSPKNKTLVLDQSRTQKLLSNHPPKTFKEVPGKLEACIFVRTLSYA